LEDVAIIDYMKFLLSKSEEARIHFQAYRDNDFMDNLSLLHIAAKYSRYLVCEFLIKVISISNLKYFRMLKNLNEI
jgi:ankyrin repeat protein